MKILITGGAGYIGSVITKLFLEKGHQVTVLDSLMHRQPSVLSLCSYKSFDFVFGDVRDFQLMQQLAKDQDVIVPLAAIVGVKACDIDPWSAKSVNLEAIQLLISILSPNQLVVYPTTNSGYGTKSGDICCTEDTPLEPISLYGKTKVQAEQELLSLQNIITLRLATVFGVSPRMRWDLLVNNFVYNALKHQYLVIFEQDYKRNFVHIQDVADCFLFCTEHWDAMAGRSYNLGLDSANMSKGDLAHLIQRYIPSTYIHFASYGSDPDKRNYIVSNQRLRSVGFEAKRTIDDGINELIKGYHLFDHA